MDFGVVLTFAGDKKTVGFYLYREIDLDMDALDTLLNKESGLKGICGENDQRTISELYNANQGRIWA